MGFGDLVPPIRGYTNLLTIARAFAGLWTPLPDEWGTKEIRQAVERAMEKKILEVLFDQLQDGRIKGMDTSHDPEIPFDPSIHTTPMKAAFVGLKGAELQKAVSLLLGHEVASGPSQALANVPQRLRTKAQQQEDAILAKLVELNYNPKALPRRPNGKPWPVKQQVRDALSKRLGESAFNKAWQRLRDDDDGRIREV